MTLVLKSRVTLLWLALLLASFVSWEAVEGIAWLRAPRMAGALVVAIAFVKARYIMLDFMELRHAPAPMRLFAEAWWLLVGAIIIIAFWTGIFAVGG